jgi:hypothetical protein
VRRRTATAEPERSSTVEAWVLGEGRALVDLDAIEYVATPGDDPDLISGLLYQLRAGHSTGLTPVVSTGDGRRYFVRYFVPAQAFPDHS